MLTAIQGVYRRGRIHLAELPRNVTDETQVVVTFLKPSRIDLQARGISDTQAADLRARLATFAEDWNNQEMDMLATDVPFILDAQLTTIDVPNPNWLPERA